MKNEKLTVLDFKKEQLVNLNEEDMMAVKGGFSSVPCVGLGIGFASLAYHFAKGESYIHCENEVYTKNFNVTKEQFTDVTCYSVPPVVIYGHR